MNWQTERVLVTGGGGFLGRHLVRKLHAMGVSPIVPRKAEYDLRQQPVIRALLQTVKPTLIIHAAAHVGGIGANQAAPGQLFYDNALMGIQLMHEACASAVDKFVTIGTVCAYPGDTPTPFQESALWDGYPEPTNAAYALAKKMLLVQGQAYRQQYGFNSIHLLLANLYGAGDNDNPTTSHVIPAIVRKMRTARETNAEVVSLWGTGMATRDFLYVEDAADGILAACADYDEPEPLNLGTGIETSIRDLALLIAEQVGYAGNVIWDYSKPDGQARRQLSTANASGMLGWRATTPLREGLHKTITEMEGEHA